MTQIINVSAQCGHHALINWLCIYHTQVSERAKGHCMARALTPMEILMEEIRTPPTLRRVHNTMSDSVVVNNKKKLMPSPELVADLSEEVSS